MHWARLWAARMELERDGGGGNILLKQTLHELWVSFTTRARSGSHFFVSYFGRWYLSIACHMAASYDFIIVKWWVALGPRLYQIGQVGF